MSLVMNTINLISLYEVVMLCSNILRNLAVDDLFNRRAGLTFVVAVGSRLTITLLEHC